MKCSNCGYDNDSGSLFCANCGKKIEIIKYRCSCCGNEIGKDDLFCGSCGYNLSKKENHLESRVNNKSQHNNKIQPNDILRSLTNLDKKKKRIISIIFIAIIAIGIVCKLMYKETDSLDNYDNLYYEESEYKKFFKDNYNGVTAQDLDVDQSVKDIKKDCKKIKNDISNKRYHLDNSHENLEIYVSKDGDIKEIKVNKDKKSQECDREYYYDDYIGLIYARAYNDEHEYEMYYTYDDILIRYIKDGDSYDYKKISENKWSYFTLEEGKDLYEMYHDDYDEDSDDYSYNDEDDYSSTDYILLNSDERYIDKSELSSLGQWQLRLARNEIYARYGYSFEDEELRRYFLNKSWYEEDSSINKDTWSDDCLNEYEKANRDLIVSYEEEMGYR
ncbi:MAG: YARHG domain-containing protein [Faecalibacillus faecis]